MQHWEYQGHTDKEDDFCESHQIEKVINNEFIQIILSWATSKLNLFENYDCNIKH